MKLFSDSSLKSKAPRGQSNRPLKETTLKVSHLSLKLSCFWPFTFLLYLLQQIICPKFESSFFLANLFAYRCTDDIQDPGNCIRWHWLSPSAVKPLKRFELISYVPWCQVSGVWINMTSEQHNFSILEL